MAIDERANAEAFTNIYFRKSVQVALEEALLRPETFGYPFEITREDTPFLLEIWKQDLLKLTKTIFARIRESLCSNVTAVFIKKRFNILALRGKDRDVIFHETLSELKYPTITDVFAKTLGITIHNTKPHTPLSKGVLISWKFTNDTTLRNLFGVPQNPELAEETNRSNEHRKSGKYVDVSFEVSTKLFQAHKIILIKNPYFAALLEGNFSESTSKAPIPIADTTPEIFDALLVYLYTKNIDLTKKTTKFLIDLAKLANRTLVPELKKLCHLHLLFALTKENVKEIESHATLHEDPVLIDACASFSLA